MSRPEQQRWSSIYNLRRSTPKLPLYRLGALDHAKNDEVKDMLHSTGITHRIDLRSPVEVWRNRLDDAPVVVPQTRMPRKPLAARRLTINNEDIKSVSVATSTASQIKASDVLGLKRYRKMKNENLVSKKTVIRGDVSIEVTHVNFLNSRYRNNVIWDRCTVAEKWKVLSYIVTFKFNKLVRFISSKMVGEGLLGSYKDFVDHSQNAINQGLRSVVTALEACVPNREAVSVNCMFGKDRTGIITALIKFVLGDTIENIVDDYNTSEYGLSKILDYMIKEFKEQGLSAEFAKSPRRVLRDLFEYIQLKYTSVDNYLDAIGFDKTWRERLLLVSTLYQNQNEEHN